MRDVTHPVADAPANSAQTNSGARAAHVLVAEDDGPLRAVIATWLSAAGYRVSGVADGEAAWDALCADAVDVLITDHDMPGLTGLELLRRVRAGPLRLPVILISGRMPWSAIDLHALLPPGLALEKPFTLPDLQAHVDALLASPPGSQADHDGQARLISITVPGPPLRRDQSLAAGVNGPTPAVFIRVPSPHVHLRYR